MYVEILFGENVFWTLYNFNVRKINAKGRLGWLHQWYWDWREGLVVRVGGWAGRDWRRWRSWGTCSASPCPDTTEIKPLHKLV